MEGEEREGSYRPCAGIMLVNRKGMIFVGKRMDVKSKYWQMPQGGIEDGEGYEEAAKRELYEETGVKDVSVWGHMEKWIYYDVASELSKKLWEGAYVGQKQKWFLMEFLGEDADVDLEVGEAEFSEWKWQSRDCLVQEAIHFKRETYRCVLSNFGRYWESSF